jgi:hypothetical protein
MLVLQVAFPGAGQAAVGGEWIEICGEFGVVEIQITEENREREQACPKCGACVLCAAAHGAIPVGAMPTSISRAEVGTFLLPAAAAVPPNPAQHWHDGRGPPLVNQNNPERAYRASLAATQIKGEAP